jgi:uncharacterized protein
MAEAQTPTMPVPIPDLDSAPFWEACRQGRLMLQRCTGCGQFRYPPKPICPRCRTLGGEWAEVSGRGKIYSWIVPHYPVHPAAVDKVPYNVVLVELEEGPRIVSNLLDVAPEQIEAGLAVVVDFEPLTETITLPKFRRAAGDQGSSGR